MKDIKTPVFAFGTERDHVAPWRSVYKVERYSSTEIEFNLKGRGYDSSVVSPPGKSGAYYRISTCDASVKYVDPDTRLASSSQRQGSWWRWVRWLDARSSTVRVTPSFLRNTGGDPTTYAPAPGSYVFEKRDHNRPRSNRIFGLKPGFM